MEDHRKPIICVPCQSIDLSAQTFGEHCDQRLNTFLISYVASSYHKHGAARQRVSPEAQPSSTEFFQWFWAEVQGNLFDGEMSLSLKLATQTDFITSLMMLGILLKTPAFGFLCKKFKFCLETPKTSISFHASVSVRRIPHTTEVRREGLRMTYHLSLLIFGKHLWLFKHLVLIACFWNHNVKIFFQNWL